MILCDHSNEDHAYPSLIRVFFLNSSCFSASGNGRDSGLFFGNKWELDYSLKARL